MTVTETQKALDGDGTAFEMGFQDINGDQSAWIKMVVGPVAENAAADGNPLGMGGRYDAAARTLGDGDRGEIALDVAGRQIVVGPAADNAAAAGNPNLMAGIFETTPSTRGNGDAVTLGMTATGALRVTQEDSSGNEITSIAVAEDAPLSGGESGILAMGKYVATPAQSAGTANDVTQPIYGALGKLWADGGISGSFTDNPTVTAGAYSDGDVIGDVMDITVGRVASGAAGTTIGVTIAIEDSNGDFDANSIEVYLFRTDPTNGTYTDNGAFSLNYDDAQMCIGVVPMDEAYPAGASTILQGFKTFPCTLTTNVVHAIAVIRTDAITNGPDATDGFQLSLGALPD